MPPVNASAAPDSEAAWFDLISPHFAQSNQSTIAGGIKLIEAKKDLKKKKGSFVRLVERLGLDLDKAERLMKVARHPVLSDSAHARNLPLSWMTLYTLAKLPPKVLEGFITDGTIHPKLKRKKAETLVQKARGSNSNGQDRDRDGNHGAEHDADHASDDDHAGDGDHGDYGDAGDHGDRGDHHGGDHGGDRDTDQVPQDSAAQDDIAGPNSRCELDRKLARLEELEREIRRQEIQRVGDQSEIEELKA